MGSAYGLSDNNYYWAKMARYMADEDLRIMKHQAMTLMATSTAQATSSCSVSFCRNGYVYCYNGTMSYPITPC